MTATPADRFIDALGTMAQTEGTPRIAGRIMGYLVLAGEPRSLSRIARDLGVSKASASTNARLLEGRGVARRLASPGERQDLWQAVPHPDRQMLLVLAERFRRNADTIAEIAREFPEDEADTRGRVDEFSEFYRGSARFFEEWHERIVVSGDCGATERSSDE